MSSTFFPSKPPAALISSIAIKVPLCDDLPKDASLPESDANSPILIVFPPPCCLQPAKSVIATTAASQRVRVIIMVKELPAADRRKRLEGFQQQWQTRELNLGYCAANAACALAFASSARRMISSGDGRLISTSGGMSPDCASFTRHFWRSVKALFASRSLLKRDF